MYAVYMCMRVAASECSIVHYEARSGLAHWERGTDVREQEGSHNTVCTVSVAAGCVAVPVCDRMIIWHLAGGTGMGSKVQELCEVHRA